MSQSHANSRLYNISCVWGWERKSVPRTTVWDHEACRVMTIGNLEGWIFLSPSHTNNGVFFLLTIKLRILCLKNAHIIRCELTWWRHFNVPMTSLIFRRATVQFVSLPQAGTGYVRKTVGTVDVQEKLILDNGQTHRSKDIISKATGSLFLCNMIKNNKGRSNYMRKLALNKE